MERKEKEERRHFKFRGKPLRGHHCLDFQKAQKEVQEQSKCAIAKPLVELIP